MAVFFVALGMLSAAWLSPKAGVVEIASSPQPSFIRTAQADTALPAVVQTNGSLVATLGAVSGQNRAAASPWDCEEGVVKDWEPLIRPSIPVAPISTTATRS